MPIISKIGGKSLRVRLIYGAIYGVLTVGALSMVYPFALMVSGSFKSETDFIYISPYPRFWTNDHILFQKYGESKYNVLIDSLEIAWWRKVGSWRKIDPPTDTAQEVLNDFLAWREQFDMPVDWYAMGHSQGGRMLPMNGRLFRKKMYEQYEGDIDAFRRETAIPAKTWSTIFPPVDHLGYSRRYRPAVKGIYLPFRQFKSQRPLRDRIIFNLDGVFWRTYLMPKYTSEIENYNQAHGTEYESYRDVFLTRRAPSKGLARQDWEEFVREELNLHFIRLDAALADAYRRYLAKQYKDINELSTRYGKNYKSYDQIPFPTTVPDEPLAQVDWERFIKDRKACPAEFMEVYGPRQAFEEFVAQRRGLSLDKVAPLPMPIQAADYHDAMTNKSQLRREFTTRNYKQVLDYILLHGHGIVNTLIYCALAIGTALLVNPLAAYALSRYNPPKTYKILLFCMATMAFPPEVTMIPAFLLLKRFPLWPLVGAAVTFGVVIWLVSKFFGRWPELLRMLLALGCALFVGAWVVPVALQGKATISLLNTFAALILPPMANGFFIFLLKGFFDSLPSELYEAADIDGAPEWTKFWTITMSLSKPILAVIALNAFTAAYSAFMMALIIIPDPDMWTLMIWIFQLQSRSHQTVVYASLVIAAIPTFLVFALCQNVIIRGIVVPVEK